MNVPKVHELDYIQFLIAAQKVFSTTEAARIQAGAPHAPAYDAYTRLLQHIPPDTWALWREVAPFVQRKAGVLVMDDTTLDKPYARRDADFKHLTGVSHATFKKMRAIVEAGLPFFGCSPKLSRADQLLMTLMYWREYRTQFRIAQTYGVSEAMVSRTIRKIEDVLIRSKQFHLSGKKALRPSDAVMEVVIIDATEQPIETAY